MKILVLGGAGAMGRVTARDLAESPDVSEVIVGDVSIESIKITEVIEITHIL